MTATAVTPVEAAKPAELSLDAKFDAIKEAATKAATAVPVDPAKVDPPAGDKPAAQPNAVEAKYIAEIARLTKETRESKTKYKDFDALAADAAKYREIAELFSKDEVSAIGKLAGKDGIDAMSELMEKFYSRENVDAPAAETMPAWAKALTAEIASLKEGKAKEQTDAETTAKAVKSAEEKAGADKFIQAIANKQPASFEVSLRPDNLAEATDNAHAAILAIATRDGVDLAKADDATRDRVIFEAWTEVENEFENVAKRTSKGTPKQEAAPAFDPEKYTRPLSKPAPMFTGKPENTTDLDKIIAFRVKQFQERSK